MKHTPAPWKAIPDSNSDNNWIVVSEDYGTIVHRNCYPNSKVDKNVEGDARLIAAAPELLEALENSLAIITSFGDADIIKQVRAAIAKAKGE